MKNIELFFIYNIIISPIKTTYHEEVFTFFAIVDLQKHSSN